ncbi:hypothetical protein ACFQVD_15140 [Streptosporangium amethystogenes subsp. fukuiense]|uniref:Polyketide synthase extender module SpnB-like Rossmann fold domain-containing protein n=1 Tax=Streptosporangium amethystogenes subsp. fukuiense TaxID=698418 RepID=A0ABW2SYZ4_9ACTN
MVTFAVGSFEDSGVVESTHAVVARVLGLLQGWLADERFEASRLVFVTRGAVEAREGDVVADLAAAAVWGSGAVGAVGEPGPVRAGRCRR